MSIARGGTKIHRPDGTVETFRVQVRDSGYYNEFLNFHEAVALNEPIVGTVLQSYRNMELILSGLDSARRGEVVVLDTSIAPLSASALPLWTPAGQTDLFGGLDVTVNHEISSDT